MAMLSIRGYARARGCSQTAVQKAIRAGRIALTEGKIDSEAADRAWARNTDPAQQRGTLVAPAGREGADGAVPGTLTYASARARREAALAEMAEIELQRQRGELVQTKAVCERIRALARGARDMLLALPDRLAPRLAGESDPFECHRILLEELERVCCEIADGKVV